MKNFDGYSHKFSFLSYYGEKIIYFFSATWSMGYLKCLKKGGRFSNFEFSLEQYMDIITKNVSVEFYENPT